MPMRREQVAAALRYLQDKADLRGRFERATSLDPQEQDLADIAVETGASLVPGVGPALAARDFERARRADDPAGMAMAAGSAVPGGKLAGLLKRYDPVMRELDVYHGTPHRFPTTEANPLGEFDASKIGTGEGAQALEANLSKAGKAEPQPFGVQGYVNDDLRRVKQNFFSQYGVEENKQFSKDYEVVELAKLKPSENTNESKVQSLMKTMREEGNARDNPIPPIIVDSEGNILDGHHRYEAAKRLGAKYVPIVELFDKRKGPVFSE